MDWSLLVDEHIANIGIALEVFFILIIILCFEYKSVFRFLQTSLMCIMGELAGGGSVAAAFGVSDR